ncbi:MAG: cytochrome c [Acuticoccus sp.]
MTLRKERVFGATAALSLSISAVAVAHTGATGVVKERMDQMMAIGDANKALRAMFAGEAPYDAAAVAENAETIRAHSGEAIISLFPEGSLDGPTEAKPEIWEDWDEFANLANRLEHVAEGLARAAGNGPGGDETMPSMGAMMGGSDAPDMNAMMGGQAMPGMMGTGSPDMAMSADMMAEMPADRVFAMLGDTCSACHTKFRIEKD